MKKLILFFPIILFSLITEVSAAQKICSDKVISSFGVLNPQNAVDQDDLSYAVLRTSIGILNYSQITLGFPSNGTAGMSAVVDLQNDNGIVSADVLQSISISLYDSKGALVGRKSGFDFADAEVIQGSSRFKLHVGTKDNILDIASVKIRISGLASIENRIRLYGVCLVTLCPPVVGDILHASHNVQNPENAVSANSKDYALLTPPLLLGNSYIDVEFSQRGDAGKLVGFRLGEGNALLSLDLLHNITLTVYNVAGGVVIEKTGFTLADVDVLSGGRFILNIKTPKGDYKIARGRITLTSLASVATTLKVYKVVTHQSCNKNIAAAITAASDVSLEAPVAEMQVYPNPFSTYTTLKIRNKGLLNAPVNVIVSNELGNIVEQYKIAGTYTINLLEKSSPGIYFIRIISGNHTETRKIIKLQK